MTAAINSPIMIAVRLCPWDLRFAMGPISYPSPYRRATCRSCVHGDNVYATPTSHMEQIHDGFMKRKRIEMCEPLMHLDRDERANLTGRISFLKYRN